MLNLIERLVLSFHSKVVYCKRKKRYFSSSTCSHTSHLPCLEWSLPLRRGKPVDEREKEYRMELDIFKKRNYVLYNTLDIVPNVQERFALGGAEEA